MINHVNNLLKIIPKTATKKEAMNFANEYKKINLENETNENKEEFIILAIKKINEKYDNAIGENTSYKTLENQNENFENKKNENEILDKLCERQKEKIKEMENELEKIIIENNRLKKENSELKNEISKMQKFKDQQGKGRRKKELKYKNEELVEMHNKYKITYRQLAVMCGVSESTIKLRLKEINKN